jgi:uncharacterized protein involved in exopolysaccharide biosynthesis
MSNVEKKINVENDEINLKELFNVLWSGKWIVITITVIITSFAALYAVNLENIYKSEVTLAPAGENGGMNLPGQLGGLAALAGVNLDGKNGDKTALAIEILKSREFLGRFIEANDLYISLMAVKGWERSSNNLIIDLEIFDKNTNQWVRKVKEPYKPKPSLLETISVFEESLFINQDTTTGIIKIGFEHFSPILAKEIVSKLVDSINEDMRIRDLVEAEKSIEYLNKKIVETSITDLKSMLFSLIEEQTKTVMLANVRKEYVFKTIDSAVVSEEKSKPNRVNIVIGAFVFSFVFSLVIVAYRKPA